MLKEKTAGFRAGRIVGDVLFTLSAALCAAALTGCSRPRPSGAVESPSPSPPPSARFLWEAVAVLKTGENPLWFELTGDGPRLIAWPGEASLLPYTPWPLSRYIAGMIPWNGDLVLAVNRCGFFVLNPLAEGGAVLYSASDSVQWDPYAVSSLFMYENHPAVLLYRDVFFAEPSAPPPDPPFFILSRDSPVPLALSLFIAEGLTENAAGNSSGWELNSLRPGQSGFWYGRRTQTGVPQPQTVYFKTPDLSRPGEEISPGEYRNSGLPEPVSAAPAHVASFLAALADQIQPGAGWTAVELVSPDFPAARIFSLDKQDGAENTSVLRGYYREKPDPLVFAIDAGGLFFGTPGGRGLIRFSLPSLPEGFVYTGACLAGRVLAATWEEQEDSGIGAAGFMVVDAGAFGI